MRWVDLDNRSTEERKEIIVSCLNKRYYHSRDLAESVAHRRVAQQPGLVLGVYKCKFCSMYHLTSRALQYGLVAIGEKTVLDAKSDV